MNHCANHGCVVEATVQFPTDPTEVHVGLPPYVACRNLRCLDCGCAVRNAPGVAFVTRADVAPHVLSEIYDLPDLANAPLLGATHPAFRLYLCRCRRWLANRSYELEHDDRDDETLPDLPWRCGGHPAIEFPHDIYGVQVMSLAKLRDLVVRGFHGFDPPNIPPAEVRASWLTRLYFRMSSTEAGIVAQVALECLTDPDPRARYRALHFFHDIHDPRAREVVAHTLSTNRGLFSEVPDATPLHICDTTLEHTAWRLLAAAVTHGAARDLARADALAGRASRALYDALCSSDPAWVDEHAEQLARAAPDRVEDLETSFMVAPITWFKRLRGRARGAVA
jgi:hypothetical protein